MLSSKVSKLAKLPKVASATTSRGLHFTVGGQNEAKTAEAGSRQYPVVDHDYDAVVVGAGGAGLRAAFGLVQKGSRIPSASPFAPRTIGPKIARNFRNRYDFRGC